MKRRKSNSWLSSILLLVCVALFLLIYQQLTMKPDSTALARSDSQQSVILPDIPPAPSFTMASIEDYSAVLERPLFSQNRRPPPERSVPLVESKGFDFDLKGVILNDKVSTALFRRRADGEIVRLNQGDEIEGWTLRDVALDFVVIERNGFETVIDIAFRSDPPAATATRR